MHDATASTPRLIASWTTGAARSTSHVVNMTSAPWPSSLAAHAFAIAALFPCVSHVLSWSLRPVTPPRAFNWLTRSFAAASAGLSNGAIAPLLSNAQPITIGDAAGAVVLAAAVAASATPQARTTASVSPKRELGLLISTPSLSAAAAATNGITGGQRRTLLASAEGAVVGQADDAAGAKRREPVHGGKEGVEALARIGRPAEQRQRQRQRQRQDRRHVRDGGRRREPGRL